MSPLVVVEKGLIYIHREELELELVDKIVAYRHQNWTTVQMAYALYCGNTFFLPWE